MAIQYLQSFVAGLFISLAGSLPLGTLNLTAMQIAGKESIRSAIQFSIGVLVVEMAYLSITFSLAGNFKFSDHYLLAFKVVAVLFLLVLATGSFMASGRGDRRNPVVDSKLKRFTLGASMSLVNPMQIPFWMGWVVYLLSQSVIVNSFSNNVVFVVSAGVGTLLAFLVFILAGKRFAPLMEKKKRTFNVLLGMLFLAMAGYQIYQLILTT
jgi:threonine/homoserine/homoserine lactone efflux protein